MATIIRIKRVPVLTLWGAVVVARLGSADLPACLIDGPAGDV